MISDTHLHTSFSPDSGAAPEEVIRKAVSLGMKDICITDHYDYGAPFQGWVFDPDEYFETLLPLKEKYIGRISVHIGIELGLDPELADYFRKLLADYPFEYAIGSIHVLLGDDPYYRDRYDMTDEEYYRAFFKYTLECVRANAGLFDTMGHLDYVLRYGYHGAEEYSYEKFAEYIDPVLDILAENDAALEINTGAIKYGKDFLHPEENIVRKYLEKGGRKFTVGSDAHRAEDVGRGFEKAEAFLRSVGVKTGERDCTGCTGCLLPGEECGLFLYAR